jgi:mono/diheme cytochrome c family protein
VAETPDLEAVQFSFAVGPIYAFLLITMKLTTSRFLTRSHLLLTLGTTLALGAACASDPKTPDDNADDVVIPAGKPAVDIDPNKDIADPTDPQKPNPAVSLDSNIFSGLATEGEQLKKLCARNVNSKDAVSAALCINGAPNPKAQFKSLGELHQLLGLKFGNPGANGLNGDGGNAAFAFLGHSTSLVTRLVSAANPRSFVFKAPKGWKPSASTALDPRTGMTPPRSWEPRHDPNLKPEGKTVFSPDQKGWVKPPNWTPPTVNQQLNTWPPGSHQGGGGGGCGWGGCPQEPRPPQQPPGLTFGGESAPDPNFVVTTFTRGETLVELAAFDPVSKEIKFFVITFKVPCGADKTPASSGFGTADSKCQPGDLYSPNIEKNWSDVSVYEDVDVHNTTIACQSCHTSTNSAGEKKKTLLMFQLDDPWTHWFSPWTSGGQALTTDYFKAHPDSETYGGVPGTLISKSEPRAVELLVRENGFTDTAKGFGTLFPSREVEKDVVGTSPTQPSDNSNPGSSDAWNSVFDDSTARGTGAPVPAGNVKVTDPAKFNTAASGYKVALASGNFSAMPKMSDLISRTNEVNSGITISDSATGEQILTQACAQCHNASVAPASLSKAKFDMGRLSSMNRAQKDMAILRMRLPTNDRRHMPYEQTKILTPAQVEKAIEVLKK